jgi:hypothetical protein
MRSSRFIFNFGKIKRRQIKKNNTLQKYMKKVRDVSGLV